jgi:hypothetical protein
VSTASTSDLPCVVQGGDSSPLSLRAEQQAQRSLHQFGHRAALPRRLALELAHNGVIDVESGLHKVTNTIDMCVWLEARTEADPVATFVREIMAERTAWVGKASDLLRSALDEKMAPSRTTAWPTNPSALAARLRRCQTFLRTAGIEITFSREGRAGSRMIRMTSLA